MTDRARLVEQARRDIATFDSLSQHEQDSLNAQARAAFGPYVNRGVLERDINRLMVDALDVDTQAWCDSKNLPPRKLNE